MVAALRPAADIAHRSSLLEAALARTQATAATHTRTTRGLDQVIAIETPEQVVFSYTVAGIGSRAAAAMIDHAILIGTLILLVLFHVFVIAPALNLSNGGAWLTQRAGGWVFAVMMLVQFVA